MKESIELIVLASTKIQESSLVVQSLSEEWGRRSFLVRIGKSSPMSLFQPLNILSAEVTPNSKSELWRISGIRLEESLSGLRSNIHKNCISLFMSEVLFRCLKEGSREEGLFEWCKRSILTLDRLDSDFASFHLRFLVELCSVLGFRPSLEDIAPFAGECLKDFPALLDPQQSVALLHPLNGGQRSNIAAILLEYLSYHTDSPLNIRSLKVLRDLYSE
ncbi:MAG: DNA repair protein RecO [Candidatus Cryptobacteroides sp.]